MLPESAQKVRRFVEKSSIWAASVKIINLISQLYETNASHGRLSGFSGLSDRQFGTGTMAGGSWEGTVPT